MNNGVQRWEFLGMPAVVRSERMRGVLAFARRVAQYDAAVLITGETGAGKEIVARAVHHFSLRCGKPWVDVNCAALPESLIESELFGHERGAFSGADREKPGLFEMAHGGTLYLDEIGELEPRMQVRLLRVLDGAAFYRVGGRRKIQVDVRVVAATNRDLEEEVRRRTFRGDLYHRICQVPVHVPPLRERPEDIAPMAQFFLERQGLSAVLSEAALQSLEAYDWPGNVRQLRNTVLRAAMTHGVGRIEPEHLSLAGPSQPNGAGLKANGLVAAAPLANVEKDAILDAMNHTGGNQTRAAALLGISRRTLIRRLKDYEADRRVESATT